jgi:hypothetical protein
MFKATARQAEVIEQVIQRGPGDGDVQIVHARKIGHAEPPRFMNLPEDDFPILAVQSAPVANTPLQGSS